MSTKKIVDPPDWNQILCTDPEHNVPNMRVFMPGEYQHTCPKCGNVITFMVQEKGRLR